ncbi:Sel1 repeat protein [Thioflavicoccus mobilis 8321]|uniref:Sel1 repeat protein n=1 Tax=Thioflavicoccus mobilis 8321 TaxID=765912 RepID=L0GV04_9GAMM|nr:tetratricopeptide repeat protein [Thioflavicoccus mobilis]AGA89657.1 Sel1 repeat protein [Thioflavicoccus mobilis 8321]
MHTTQYTEPLTPFQTDTAAGGANWLRWTPIVLAAGALAIAGFLGRPVTPLGEANWLAQLAGSGNVGAELQIGLAYRDGRDGLTADAKTAFYWLQRAAQGGNAYAADQLADAYARGIGTAADPDLARHWWQVAAERGNADAKHHLGEDRPDTLETVMSVLSGKALDEQTRPALLARAEAGDAAAQYQVGLRYREGAAGFPQDTAQATAWLRRAAASGSELARESLAANRTIAQNL